MKTSIAVKQIKRHPLGDSSVTTEDLVETLRNLDNKTFNRVFATAKLLRKADKIARKALEVA